MEVKPYEPARNVAVHDVVLQTPNLFSKNSSKCMLLAFRDLIGHISSEPDDINVDF